MVFQGLEDREARLPCKKEIGKGCLAHSILPQSMLVPISGQTQADSRGQKEPSEASHTGQDPEAQSSAEERGLKVKQKLCHWDPSCATLIRERLL